VAAQICAAAGSSGKIGFFDEHGLDAGLAGPGRKIRQGETLTKAGSSGKIGSSDFSTNTGWTLDWPGQAGKFVKGKRCRKQVRRGKSDFSTNTGWTLDWPGQAGKFVKGKR
jgi:hypothetical protein